MIRNMEEFEYKNLEYKIKEQLLDNSTIQTKWFVITGAPCSGKTTVINVLSDLGFFTNPDIARLYIESEIKKGISNGHVRAHAQRFRRIIFLKMVEKITTLQVNEPFFHDYALPDNIAFYREASIEVTPDLVLLAKKYRYNKVFLFEPLPFKQDDVRNENEDFQLRIDRELKKIYRELGYEIIPIPIATVDERAKNILQHIND